MTFRFDKLTVKAQEAVTAAQNSANQTGNPEITVLHLLAALVGESEGIVHAILQKIGTPIEQLGKSHRMNYNASPLPAVAINRESVPN